MYAEATATTTPETPQYMQALKKATAARSSAADIKRDVRADRITVADALFKLDDDGKLAAGGLEILKLMICQRRCGHVAAMRILNAEHINSAKKVRDLTERQRRVIADEMLKAHSKRR